MSLIFRITSARRRRKLRKGFISKFRKIFCLWPITVLISLLLSRMAKGTRKGTSQKRGSSIHQGKWNRIRIFLLKVSVLAKAKIKAIKMLKSQRNRKVLQMILKIWLAK